MHGNAHLQEECNRVVLLLCCGFSMGPLYPVRGTAESSSPMDDGLWM